MNGLIVVQCAWCHDVKVNGSYIALRLPGIVHEIDLPSGRGKTAHYAVSHGICDPCKARMLGHSLAA